MSFKSGFESRDRVAV